MVKDDAAEGVINAVVNVVAGLAVAHRFADDRRDGCGGGGHKEPARLGQDLDGFRKEAVNLGVDLPCQGAERLDVFVVGGGKAAADVENLERMSARFGFAHYRGRNIQCLNEVLEVSALAADVEAQALDHQAQVKCGVDEVHGFAGVAAELR